MSNGNFYWGPMLGITLVFCFLLAACGGGGSETANQLPSISIDVPTSESSYYTTGSSVRLGGTISNASFVRVRNTLTGSPASVACCRSQESVGLRVNLLQIRLDGLYSAAFLVNRTTIALQNRQNCPRPA